MTRRTSERDMPCPNEANHTPCPSGYLAWHEWAERMAETHHTVQCPGCGRWNIWAPTKRQS